MGGENYDAKKLYVRALYRTERYNEKSDSVRKLRPARERKIEPLEYSLIGGLIVGTIAGLKDRVKKEIFYHEINCVG